MLPLPFDFDFDVVENLVLKTNQAAMVLAVSGGHAWQLSWDVDSMQRCLCNLMLSCCKLPIAVWLIPVLGVLIAHVGCKCFAAAFP